MGKKDTSDGIFERRKKEERAPMQTCMKNISKALYND